MNLTLSAGRLSANGFHTIEYAVSELAAGRMVLVVDDEDRENEGDLIFAGELATAELIAFMVRYTSGVICVPMPPDECDRLGLNPMTAVNTDRKGTAFTVSVDAASGVSTGISAADRAQTILTLANPATQSADLSRPGHVFPLRAKTGGVLSRPGHTEAAVDLLRMAGCRPVGAIAEVVSEDGTGSMARLPELLRFAAQHEIAIISIADLIAHRQRFELQVDLIADARLPLKQGEFRAIGFLSRHTGEELVALVLGDIDQGDDVLARVHSECLTGDVFGSLRCRCGPQLQAALDALAAEGRGVLVYIRGHDGSGIGSLQNLRAGELLDDGVDSIDVDLASLLPSDDREDVTGASVLVALGVRSVRLISDHPAERLGLERHGVVIAERVPLRIDTTQH